MMSEREGKERLSLPISTTVAESRVESDGLAWGLGSVWADPMSRLSSAISCAHRCTCSGACVVTACSAEGGGRLTKGAHQLLKDRAQPAVVLLTNPVALGHLRWV